MEQLVKRIPRGSEETRRTPKVIGVQKTEKAEVKGLGGEFVRRGSVSSSVANFFFFKKIYFIY